MKKLQLDFLASPSEIITIANVKRPSVNAPFAMSTFNCGPRPIPGKVARMSLTPYTDPTTFRSKKRINRYEGNALVKKLTYKKNG